MTITNNNAVRTPESLQQKLAIRRISLDAAGQPINQPQQFDRPMPILMSTQPDNIVNEQLELKSVVADIISLSNKFKDTERLLKPCGEVLNLVNYISSTSVYRHGSIVIVGRAYGYVISTDVGDIEVTGHEALLNVMLTLAIKFNDEKVINQIAEAFEYIVCEYLDMCNNNQPNASNYQPN